MTVHPYVAPWGNVVAAGVVGLGEDHRLDGSEAALIALVNVNHQGDGETSYACE